MSTRVFGFVLLALTMFYCWLSQPILPAPVELGFHVEMPNLLQHLPAPLRRRLLQTTTTRKKIVNCYDSPACQPKCKPGYWDIRRRRRAENRGEYSGFERWILFISCKEDTKQRLLKEQLERILFMALGLLTSRSSRCKELELNLVCCFSWKVFWFLQRPVSASLAFNQTCTYRNSNLLRL